MTRGRALVAALLVISGVALAAFFWLVFAISDCSETCQLAGERAVPLALVGAGFGLVAGGIAVRRGPARAAGSGFLAGGALGALAIAWIMLTENARGQASWLLMVTLALAALGAWMLRTRGERRSAA